MKAVLVTDDEADTRFMLRTVLRARGWTVVEAGSGEEAIARAQAGDFDVVVLDHKMPGLTGAQTAERLRSLGFDTPIVLFSAHLSTETRLEAQAAGLDAVAKDDLPALLKVLDALRAPT